MSSPTLQPSLQGGHSPLSNQPDEGPAITETLQAEPGTGVSERYNELTNSGTEAGQGFDFSEGAESVDVNVFTPPQSDELRDIGEASFGMPPSLNEDVIGVDNRTRVADTTAYPWRVMCSLLITAADNSNWV